MANHLVIMAGGIGSRFWPMSTPECPKQFLDITGCGRTMIQQTFDRFGDLIDIKHVWVVTARHFAPLVAQQLDGICDEHILLEPCMRNTAPCIAYVSWKILQEDPEATIVVSPSDHLVSNTSQFQKVVSQGLDFVRQGDRILTLGMQPTRPETGYGYIEQGEAVSAEDVQLPIYTLKAFREKPDLSTAQHYLSEGGYTWNSGLFLWSVQTIVSELRRYTPEIATLMDQMSPYFFTPNEQEIVDRLFPECTKISIDYAVMEKTSLAYVLPAEFGWSDLGTWGSLHTLSSHDEGQNAVIGNGVKMIESSGCMVHMPQGKQVVIQGLENCIVAEHNGVLMICRLSEEQRIKEWHD